MSIHYAAIYRSEAAQTWKAQVIEVASTRFDCPNFWDIVNNDWLKAMYRNGHSPAVTVLIYETVASYRMYDFATNRDVIWGGRRDAWDFAGLHAARRH